MLPDIDSLALFVRAAELRSLTKAANASNIGLAAASRRIALLEHRFKTPLLERSSKGVELSSAGLALLPQAKALLLQLNQMQADMADFAAGRKGVLRVLASTSSITQFLPEDLASFSAANPEVRLIVEERWTAEIIRAVRAGEADIGVILEGSASDGLDTFDYRSDRIAAVLPPGHILGAAATVEFADLLDYDLIGLESGSSLMRLLTEQAVAIDKVLRLRVQVRSFEAVCRMVQAGLGIGMLPLQAASALAGGLGLSTHALSEPWAVRRMLVGVKQDRSSSLSLRKLVEHLRSSQTKNMAAGFGIDSASR
jgi:DNA-binding transcriptional LysR family regulator